MWTVVGMCWEALYAPCRSSYIDLVEARHCLAVSTMSTDIGVPMLTLPLIVPASFRPYHGQASISTSGSGGGMEQVGTKEEGAERGKRCEPEYRCTASSHDPRYGHIGSSRLADNICTVCHEARTPAWGSTLSN